jgi:hypothetical protein
VGSFDPTRPDRGARGRRWSSNVSTASGGQFTAASTVADVAALDFGKVNPVTGPVYVDGAEPGDALKVTLHEFKPSGFGWTANIPGFGLLADQFTEGRSTSGRYDPASLAPALFGPMAKVPLKPFAGTIGLAPAEAGLHSVVPPRRVGGNMDIRDLSAGTTLYLPVEVAGGAVLDRRHPRRPGRRRGLRHGHREPDERGADLDLVKDAKAGHAPLHHAGPVTRHLDEGLRGDHRHRPRSDEGARMAVSA